MDKGDFSLTSWSARDPTHDASTQVFSKRHQSKKPKATNHDPLDLSRYKTQFVLSSESFEALLSNSSGALSVNASVDLCSASTRAAAQDHTIKQIE